MKNDKTKKTKPYKSSYLPAYLMIVVAILVAAVLIVGGLYVWYYSTIAGPIAQLANNQQALSEQIQKLDPNATDDAVVEEEEEEAVDEEEDLEEEEMDEEAEEETVEGLKLSNEGDMEFYTADLDRSEYTFKGSITVTGTYTYYEKGAGILSDIVCFNDIKDSDFKKFPKFETDKRKVWFCFSNQALAKKTFGPEGSTGKATIEIDNYVITLMETAAWNRAELIEVVK